MTLTVGALQVWLAAIEEGFVAPADWVMWAETALVSASPVPAWLVDLYEASTREEGLSAASAGLRALCGWPPSALPYDHTSLRLGMMWLLHERREIDLSRLLARAGALVDAANYGSPACEAFYCLLSEMDGGGPSSPTSVPISMRTAELFAAHAAAVREMLDHLRA